MKPVLKLKFVDFWEGFDPRDNYFFRTLSAKYELVLSDTPEILVYSCYGTGYLSYDCVRVFYTAENMRVDFTACDFAIGFDYIERENYLRLPLYILYLDGDLDKLVKKEFDPEAILASKTGFCNMVVSNGNSQRRIRFFKKLSQYKKVDSGGRYLNNIGGPVENKREFIRKYKFSLAFENSSYPGYTTEKIMEPMLVHSIPVYWGNPLIGREFNTKSFLNYFDYNSDEALIERIIELDKKDELYLQYLAAPFLNGNIADKNISTEALLSFFDRVIDRSKHITPIAITYKRHIHEFRRKSKLFLYEVKKLAGIKNFR